MVLSAKRLFASCFDAHCRHALHPSLGAQLQCALNSSSSTQESCSLSALCLFKIAALSPLACRYEGEVGWGYAQGLGQYTTWQGEQYKGSWFLGAKEG